MTTEVAVAERRSVVRDMAHRYNMEDDAFEATVRATCMPTGHNVPAVTRAEFAAGIAVAHHYTLNPLLREIYFYPRKGGGIVPVVSVDGWASLINRRAELDGIHFQDHHAENGTLISITCTIYRKDRKHPTTVTEYLSECFRDTIPWKMPHRMLRHKALIQCARYAFGFAGIHDDDEAQRIVEAVEVEQSRISGPQAPDDGQMVEAEEVLAAQANAPRREEPAPKVEEVKAQTQRPGPEESGDPTDHKSQGDDEGEFDAEAWVLERRVDYNQAQSEKRVDDIHAMFEETANDLPQDLRIQYEDAHQEALARFASGMPAAATEQPAGPNAPDDDEDGGFPGQSAIDALRTGNSMNLGDESGRGPGESDRQDEEGDDEGDDEEEDSEEVVAFKADMDAILNGTWASHDELKKAFDARSGDLQAFLADGDVSAEYDAELRAALRTKYYALRDAVGKNAGTGDAQADAMTERLRVGLAECTDIDAVNALATATLVERNAFGSKHPLHKVWKGMVVARRKELSAIG